MLSMITLGMYYDFQDKVLFILIPSLFFIAFINDIKTPPIKGNKEFIAYIILVCIALSSVFYSPPFNFQMFLYAFPFLLGTLIASYIPLGLNKNKNYEDFFHLGFVVSIVGLILIEYFQGNFILLGFETGKIGRDKFTFNANYYSYISFFANFSLFYLHVKYRNFLTTISTIILPILFIILAFVTQSRAGLLITILINGIFWFLIIKNTKGNLFYRLAKNVILISVTLFIILQFVNIYQNSQIKNRMAKSSDDSRGELAMQALVVFTNHPFTGVGLGQFPRYTKTGLFSHNSYTEILAEHGIIGGIVLFMLFGMPTFKSYKNLKINSKSSLNRLNFLFFITFLIYNNAYVFYKASFAMLYFFLIISIQNNADRIENKTESNNLK
tara:strand:- start:16971 stop:18122 length:1152 start_codon:yes stop_codon:yes gene_type:complete